MSYKQREKLFFHTLLPKRKIDEILRVTFFPAINRLLIFFREGKQNETFRIFLIEENETTLKQRTQSVVTISVIVLKNCSMIDPNRLFVSLALYRRGVSSRFSGEKIRN